MKPPEKDISSLLRAAMMAQRQGAVRDARRLYEQALRAAPRHPDALHLLGLTWIDEGQTERGLQLIRRAIAYRPDYLEAINNIAIELAKLDRHAEARGFLEKALRLNDAQPDVHFNMGRSLNALGDFQGALASYDRAVALQPRHHEAWYNRGITLHAGKEHTRALDSYDRALALKPDYHEVWTNRGVCLHDLGRFDEALASYDNAIAAKPDYADAWLQRGNTLHDSDRKAEALSAYDKAIELQPDAHMAWVGRAIVLSDTARYAESLACLDKARALHAEDGHMLTTRAITLQRLGRPGEALACAERATALEANSHEVWSARGGALNHLRRDQEALACYDRAMTLAPEQPDIHVNRAYTLLALGQFAEGWREHEYRWKLKNRDRRPDIRAPDWRGEALDGKHILVFTEQGIGDVVQFARYLPLLRARGADVTFLCPANVPRLLRRPLDGVTVITESTQSGAPDFQCSLLSLPLGFRIDLDSIPAGVPYLSPEPALRARWEARIGMQGRRIGIAWQGNPAGSVDIGRSFPLSRFAVLAGMPGLRLIRLQKGFGTEQLAEQPAGMVVESLGDDFDAGADVFVDTAAVMSHLDLVITSDTAVAHVAGALGRPVWVALKYAPDWRWLQDRADSPWYPSMRLFRQPAPGDWESVFNAIRAALETP